MGFSLSAMKSQVESVGATATKLGSTSSNPLAGIVQASDALQNYSDQAVGATRGLVQGANGFIGTSSAALQSVGLAGMGVSNYIGTTAGVAPLVGATPPQRLTARQLSGGGKLSLVKGGAPPAISKQAVTPMATSAFLGEAQNMLEKQAARSGVATSTFVGAQNAPTTSSGAPAPLATAEKSGAARGVGIMSKIPKWALILVAAGGAWFVWKKVLHK